jgi:hypothetical protein
VNAIEYIFNIRSGSFDIILNHIDNKDLYVYEKSLKNYLWLDPSLRVPRQPRIVGAAAKLSDQETDQLSYFEM